MNRNRSSKANKDKDKDKSSGNTKPRDEDKGSAPGPSEKQDSFLPDEYEVDNIVLYAKSEDHPEVGNFD